jgi:hypothetical protein
LRLLLEKLITGRSPDIETTFKKKRGVFLKILRWAGHPILRPFLRKAWSFLKNFKRGRLPDIETVS